MAKKKKDFQQELDDLRMKYGALFLVPCTDEENERYGKMLERGEPLPKGLFKSEESNYPGKYIFMKQDTPCFSKEEQWEYVEYKKLRTLETIKNCLIFFTVLAIIGLVGAFISILNLL